MKICSIDGQKTSGFVGENSMINMRYGGVCTDLPEVVDQPKNMVVREGGLEPPYHCWRQDLNLVRLPISPPAP